MYSDHGFPLPYSQTLSTSMIFSLLKKNKQNPKTTPQTRIKQTNNKKKNHKKHIYT